MSSTISTDSDVDTASANALLRPKLLAFETNDNSTLTISALRVQQTPIGNNGTSVKTPAATPSPTSPSSAACDMPQWKKELLHRRKTNVARTMMAADVNVAADNDNDVVGHAELHEVADTADNLNLMKVQQQQEIITTTSHMSVIINTTNNKQNQTNATLAPITTTTTDNSSSVAAVSVQQQEQQQQNQQLWQLKNAKTKMPATIYTSTQSINELTIATANVNATAATAILVKSPTSPSIREKAEKLLCSSNNSSSGGHYTPLAIYDCERMKRKQEDLIGITTTMSEYAADATTTVSGNSVVQKQRSLYMATCSASSTKFCAANSLKTEVAATTQTTTNATIMDLPNQKEAEDMQVVATTTTTTAAIINRKPTSLAIGSGTHLDNICTSTIRTTGARTPLTQQQAAQQSNLKRDSEQTLPPWSALCTSSSTERNEQTLTAAAVATVSKHNKLINGNKTNNYIIQQQTQSPTKTANASINKLYNSLQNNQFIKSQHQQEQQQQQQQQQVVSPKKFKKKQESNTTTTTIIATSVTGSPTNLCASAVVCKKKMVAVQEMKNTTQNASHHHHHHHHNVHHTRHTPIIGSGNDTVGACGNIEQPQQQQQQQQIGNSVGYDSGEDLSYGPGIVEKLRDRYLSWAARGSLVEEQRRSLETLRRATSLSTLLDREQSTALHDDDIDQDDVDDDDEESHVVDNDDAKQEQIIEKTIELSSKDINVQPVPAQRHTINKQQQPKVVSGILKSSNIIAESSKKTTTFHNEQTIEQSNGNLHTLSARGSRALKRGNDSLKRARSVEALLCERTAWNFAVNTTTINNVVSIEDKIHNARERLLSGTDAMPPKRLTSIIDETERPPPDLVKQTLKKFEATANRRPRTTRANSKGEVASKVATFKSIINEQKPATVALLKPVLHSPTKRTSQQLDGVSIKPVAKPVVLPIEDVLGSTNARRSIHNTVGSPLSPPANKLKSGSSLSDHTPDLIPRQKHLLQKMQHSTPINAAADSPVTALTRKLENLCIKPNVVMDSPITALSKRMEKMRFSTELTPPATIDQMHEVNDRANETLENKQIDSSSSSDKYKENKLAMVGDDAATAIATITTAAAAAENIIVAQIRDDEATLTNSVDKHCENNDNADVNHLAAETTGIASLSSSSVYSDDEDSLGLTKRVSRRALENIAKAGTTQQFKFANNNNNTNNIIDNSNNMRPLITSVATSSVKQKSAAFAATQLTTREIEKNRINDLKKTTNLVAENLASSSASSLDNVIQKHATATGQSELDASSNAAGASPLWGAMCKRRVAPPVAVPDNTTMVFNFSNRKEVPDYIENDGVIFRRKRDLPKPNESGFVMLGDLTLETSTDSDYDEFSLCPPSPCDVEFENANIVIDGKSSIRQKPKEASSRVQFNDILTSTFEYPSEASLIVDEDTLNSPYAHTENSLISNYENLIVDETDSPANQHHHHHVVVDEIIQLPIATANYSTQTQNVANNVSTSSNNVVATTTTTTTVTTNTPTKNVLGNLPLGSAPLGSYTPLKAPIDNLFQLGVTRAPNSNGHAYNGSDDGGSIIGIADGLINGDNAEAPDSLQQYLKPTNDDLTVAYSEGAHKTDLLY